MKPRNNPLETLRFSYNKPAKITKAQMNELVKQTNTQTRQTNNSLMAHVSNKNLLKNIYYDSKGPYARHYFSLPET